MDYKLRAAKNSPAVLAVTANSVLVADDLPKFGAHLVAALAGLDVDNFARRDGHCFFLQGLKDFFVWKERGGGGGR